jgi:hypothetical protein
LDVSVLEIDEAGQHGEVFTVAGSSNSSSI